MIALLMLAACTVGCSGPLRASGSAVAPSTSAGSPPSAVPSAVPAPAATPTPTPTASPTGQALVGTGEWHLTQPAKDGEIEGFTSRVSGVPGTAVHLKVSTVSRSYRVTAFRLGAYRGGVAHRVWHSARLTGTLQPGPTFSDARTRTITAPWRTSTTIDTTGWEPGFYLLKLVSSQGWQSLVPYVVRSVDLIGKVVLVAPVATWQAYNDWGGYSLYKSPVGAFRSWAVSFDRPYPAPGAGEMKFGVLPVAVAAERAHVPLGYATDMDLDAHPQALVGASAYVSMGHDEYWSHRMRSAVEQARASGTNLLFMGANTAYWKVRAESSGTGRRRVVVGYKTDARLDPARLSHPQEATGLAREDPVDGLENQLTGMKYECFPVDTDFQVAAPHWWGFRGTHVRVGTAFRHLMGVEADRVYPIATTPHPLQILSDVSYTCDGVPTSAQSTYYTVPSGAGVLDLGTLRWTCALVGRCDAYRLDPATVGFVQRVTHTVLRDFAQGPAGLRHPAHDNVGRFDLPTVNTVPAS